MYQALETTTFKVSESVVSHKYHFPSRIGILTLRGWMMSHLDLIKKAMDFQIQANLINKYFLPQVRQH